MKLIALTFAALLAILAPGCTGVKYLTEDLQGKTVVVVKSGWGVDMAAGALTDGGSPLSIEAGRIATVYISSKDGDKMPSGLAEVIAAARGDFTITAEGISETAPAATGGE